MSSNNTYYVRNKERLQEKARVCYSKMVKKMQQNIMKISRTSLQERLQEQARNKYRESSNKEKDTREYGRNRCRNMLEEDKQKLKECKKWYRNAKCLFFIMHNVKDE